MPRKKTPEELRERMQENVDEVFRKSHDPKTRSHYGVPQTHKRKPAKPRERKKEGGYFLNFFPMYRKHRAHHSLVYLEKDGKYYLLHRTRSSEKPEWVSPGVRMVREFRGQGGLAVGLEDSATLLGACFTKWTYRGVIDIWDESTKEGCIYSERYYVFHVTEWLGALRTECDEGVFEWVDKADLASLGMKNGDRLAQRLLEKDLRFSYLDELLKDGVCVYTELNTKPVSVEEWGTNDRPPENIYE